MEKSEPLSPSLFQGGVGVGTSQGKGVGTSQGRWEGTWHDWHDHPPFNLKLSFSIFVSRSNLFIY
jgi:hypothetical protein